LIPVSNISALVSASAKSKKMFIPDLRARIATLAVTPTSTAVSAVLSGSAVDSSDCILDSCIDKEWIEIVGKKKKKTGLMSLSTTPTMLASWSHGIQQSQRSLAAQNKRQRITKELVFIDSNSKKHQQQQ
jgi:hypothetical protein